MMLMTYDEFAEIPSKMHIFYDQAFNVLYNKHDATKASFRRKFYTPLSVDDFKRLLSTFSLFSYIDRKIALTDKEAREYVRKATQYESINIDPDSYISDLHESVCILLKDGDLYTFLHRSFQEYFVALFLASREVDRISAILDAIVDHVSSDGVISLLIDMNRDAFETQYFKTKVSSLREKLDKIDASKKPKAVWTLFYRGISIERGEISGYEINSNAGYWDTLHVIEMFYKPHKGPRSAKGEGLEWSEIVDKYGLVTDEGNIEIRNERLSDELLVDLGLASYIRGIKKRVQVVEEDIEKRTRKKKDLISDMLNRKKRSGGVGR